MPRFDLPHFPSGAQKGLKLLQIKLDASLDDEEFASIEHKLGKPDDEDEYGPSWHGTLREPIDWPGFVGELSGVIGVHNYKNGPAPDLGYLVHCGLGLRERDAGRKPRPPLEVGWDHLTGLVWPLTASLAPMVTLHLTAPRSTTAMAVTLPIALGPTVSGFDEIRGFQLAKMNPEGREDILYSVILQLVGEDLSVAVTTEAKVPFNSSLLAVAAEQALAVAKLAVPKWEGT